MTDIPRDGFELNIPRDGLKTYLLRVCLLLERLWLFSCSVVGCYWVLRSTEVSMDIRGLRYIVSSTTRVASRVARQQVLRTSNRRLYSTSRLRTWRLHGAKDIRSFLPAVEKSCTEPAMHKMEPELQKRITNESDKQGIGKKYFIETLGCQMNVSDSEIVATVLNEQGFLQVKHWKEADIVLLNTCAIRENAEEKAIQRLRAYKSTKQARRAVSQIERNQQQNRVVGVLGCMAERLKEKLLDETKVADLVVGPDAYRDLPNLLKIVTSGPEGEDSENFQKVICSSCGLWLVDSVCCCRPSMLSSAMWRRMLTSDLSGVMKME